MSTYKNEKIGLCDFFFCFIDKIYDLILIYKKLFEYNVLIYINNYENNKMCN